jgi:hypothetical protein
MKRPICPLFSVLCRLFADTRHLTPVLLKKKIDKSNPYFVNYLQDATLDSHIIPQSDRQAGDKGYHHFKSLLIAGTPQANADRVSRLPADP